MLSWVLAVAAWLEMRLKGNERGDKSYVYGTLLVAVASLFSLYQIVPPADSGYSVGWFTSFKDEHLVKVVGIVWKVFCPVPLLQVDFWNTNILDPLVPLGQQVVGMPAYWSSWFSLLIQAFLGGVIWLGCLLVFANVPRSLVLLSLGFGGILLFFI